MLKFSEILIRRNRTAANSSQYEAAVNALMALETNKTRLEAKLAEVKRSRTAIAKALPLCEQIPEDLVAPVVAPAVGTRNHGGMTGVMVKSHVLGLLTNGLTNLETFEARIREDLDVCIADIKLQERNRDEAERNHSQADERELVAQ